LTIYFVVENIFSIKINKCQQDKETFLIPTPEVNKNSKDPSSQAVLTPTLKPENQNFKERNKPPLNTPKIV
jgi:hypothetical protein